MWSIEFQTEKSPASIYQFTSEPAAFGLRGGIEEVEFGMTILVAAALTVLVCR